MRMNGNTILITGGGSGIGRGLAEAFHKLGNKVIIAGRRENVLRETTEASPGMESVQLDAANADSIANTTKDLLARFPDLNVVINNAGVQRTHEFSAEAGLNAEAAVEEVETNINGVLRMTDAFLAHLKSKPYAVLVNVSSGLAFVPMARFPVYCATKAFVHSFTVSLRQQLRGSTIEVLELAPPWVKTELDTRHPATAPADRGPMPLDAFIEEAMKEFATDAVQLNVAGAKYLYGGGVSERFDSTFEQINAH